MVMQKLLQEEVDTRYSQSCVLACMQRLAMNETGTAFLLPRAGAQLESELRSEVRIGQRVRPGA